MFQQTKHSTSGFQAKIALEDPKVGALWKRLLQSTESNSIGKAKSESKRPRSSSLNRPSMAMESQRPRPKLSEKLASFEVRKSSLTKSALKALEIKIKTIANVKAVPAKRQTQMCKQVHKGCRTGMQKRASPVLTRRKKVCGTFVLHSL